METDAPSVLWPCAICARTFMPQSLEKHVKICERAMTKKRKPFDSAKQRIQGTDLAEFLPRQERKRSLYEEKRKSSWKETHDDFLRTIRAARGRTTDADDQAKQLDQAGQRQSSSHASSSSSGVPMRANEKGTCPTCNRRFGVKAYERHVAWCKERSTRLPNNFPATNNVAKERLEARMKYRAPVLKNRRASNKEKYSQSSSSAPNIVTPTAKNTVSNEGIRSGASRSNLSRTRETLSVGDARRGEKSTDVQRSMVTTTGRGEPSPQVPNSTEATERTTTAKRSSHLTNRMAVVCTRRRERARRKGKGASDDLLPMYHTESANSSAFLLIHVLSLLLPLHRPKSSSRSVGLPASRTLHLPVCVSLTRKNLENETESLGENPVQCSKYPLDDDKVLSRGLEGNGLKEDKTNGVNNQIEIGNIEKSTRALNSTRSRKGSSSIAARARSESKVNDVKVNENVLGMLVKPCNITYKDDRLITWEKMSRGDKVDCHSFADRIKNDVPIRKNEDYLSIEEETPPCDLLSPPSSIEEPIGKVAWSSAVRKLNRTYLIKDSVDHDAVFDEGSVEGQEHAVIRHSPRVEFHVIKATNVDRCNDSTSVYEDKRFSEIIDKSDNEDVSVLETDVIGEEKNFCCDDTRSLRSKVSSIDEKESFHDDLQSTRKSEVDLSESVLFKCEDDLQLEERDEEVHEQCQELVEEPCESLVEYQAASETREFEEKIIDLEHIEPPIPCSSYTPEVRGNSCNEQDTLPDESQSIQANECGIFEISSNKISEEKIARKLEDDSSFVEKNDSQYNQETIDRLDITIEGAYESVGETNTQVFVNCDKDSMKEKHSEFIAADNMDDNIEETQFITISKSHVKLERPLPIPIPIHRLNLIRIDSKIQKNMNLLRGSTDTLISSVEAIDLVTGQRSNELHRNSSEEEDIKDLYRQNRSEKSRILPIIKVDRGNMAVIRERSPKNSRSYWEKASKCSKDRSNDLLPYDYRHNKLRKRNPKIRILPPVLIDHSSRIQSGTCKEYDPFLLAERQMHDLLHSDSSDLSTTLAEEALLPDRARTGSTKRRESLYPLSHSSAFVDYPSQISSTGLEKRSIIEAVTTGGAEFDELASDFSSDSTETNSISREIFLRDFNDTKERDRQKEDSPNRARGESSKRELGRRMILDKSIVLGNEVIQEDRSNRNDRRLTSIKLKPSKVLRSLPNRSQPPIRAYSAPKSIYERKTKTSDVSRDVESSNIEKRDRTNLPIHDNDRKNDYVTLSSSDLSLNSIVSSEVDIKRSNSVFDELITSFEDDVLGNNSFPSLRSLLRNESLRAYDNSPVHGPGSRQQHEDRISDEEYSSPDNYKQQEQKFNADSAYSSLNRKSNYSNHGRSTNDGQNRFEDNSSRNNRRESQTTSISAGKTKCRMSRFCHECGSKFPETAKFCCQCGVKRLTL